MWNQVLQPVTPAPSTPVRDEKSNNEPPSVIMEQVKVIHITIEEGMELRVRREGSTSTLLLTASNATAWI